MKLLLKRSVALLIDFYLQVMMMMMTLLLSTIMLLKTLMLKKMATALQSSLHLTVVALPILSLWKQTMFVKQT